MDFAPLQGELAGELELSGYDQEDGGSMVLYRESDGARFFRGDALIELGGILGGVWQYAARCFALLPRSWRDAIYLMVARNRHRISRCIRCGTLPEEGLRQRMRK